MEKDIQNYSPTVMFRGTPCILGYRAKRCGLEKTSEVAAWEFAHMGSCHLGKSH